MKVSKEFSPTTICLETEQEVNYMKSALLTYREACITKKPSLCQFYSWKDELPLVHEQWADRLYNLL